jgi:hypothetical protein
MLGTHTPGLLLHGPIRALTGQMRMFDALRMLYVPTEDLKQQACVRPRALAPPLSHWRRHDRL